MSKLYIKDSLVAFKSPPYPNFSLAGRVGAFKYMAIDECMEDSAAIANKIKNKNIQICKKKTKGLSKKQFDLQIIEPMDESILDGGAKQKKKKRKPKKKKRNLI